MKSFIESLSYIVIKGFAVFVRLLPVNAALFLGRVIGRAGYYLDRKHKSLAYANIKIAFAKTKKPSEIKLIVKRVFQNFGQDFIELFRLPLIYKLGPEKFIKLEGREHIDNALKKKKGVILLAMHFGSWELSSLITQLIHHPYKVIVKSQKRFSKLDELLNSYRQCGGSVAIFRGLGTRELVASLRNNEVIGIVVDQGGRDGALVKFFGREASMSVGAIRLGLKFGTPVCFAIIIREKGPYHRLVVHPPLELVQTGNTEKDVLSNLGKITKTMEEYITQYPSEYMWFYKIWKYSKESSTVIIHDGKTGHLRQSQAVARMIDAALGERGVHCETKIVTVQFKNPLSSKALTLLSFLVNAHFCQGRLRYFKWFLTKKSFKEISSTKADYVVSCGSAGAGVNFILSSDCRAKSIAVMKPGFLSFAKFNLVVLPQHDIKKKDRKPKNVTISKASPNLITKQYLDEQSELLLKRYPALSNGRTKIGIFLGGESKNLYLEASVVRIVCEQIKKAACRLNAQVLLTTSRRTPQTIEALAKEVFEGNDLCPVCIIANEENIPEAVGGILGLSSIAVVSGDSISMISEAATSSAKTIVFEATAKKRNLQKRNKHGQFIRQLCDQGHIILSAQDDIEKNILHLAESKTAVQPIKDNPIILDAIRKII